MVRLAVSVEGQTEEKFVKAVISPHLQTLDIYAQPILLGGHGGDVSIPRIEKELHKLARSFEQVTTFYDFYGFRGKNPNENKASLEQRITNCVAVPMRAQIIPYIQMYEFEGLLFSSPAAIENNIHQSGLEAWAGGVLQQFGNNPERINDSIHTAPSKRLVSQANYVKTVHGPDICKEIGLKELRRRCRGLDGWVESLEALGRG